MRACKRCLSRAAMGPDAAWKRTVLAFAREIQDNGPVQQPYAVASLRWLRLVASGGFAL